jgi:phage shock protein A
MTDKALVDEVALHRERLTLLGELMVQVHQDMAKLTMAMMVLDKRLAELEQRQPEDRGIGRSP